MVAAAVGAALRGHARHPGRRGRRRQPRPATRSTSWSTARWPRWTSSRPRCCARSCPGAPPPRWSRWPRAPTCWWSGSHGRTGLRPAGAGVGGDGVRQPRHLPGRGRAGPESTEPAPAGRVTVGADTIAAGPRAGVLAWRAAPWSWAPRPAACVAGDTERVDPLLGAGRGGDRRRRRRHRGHRLRLRQPVRQAPRHRPVHPRRCRRHAGHGRLAGRAGRRPAHPRGPHDGRGVHEHPHRRPRPDRHRASSATASTTRCPASCGATSWTGRRSASSGGSTSRTPRSTCSRRSS